MRIEQVIRDVVKGKLTVKPPTESKGTIVTLVDKDGKEYHFDDITDVTLEDLSLMEQFDGQVTIEAARSQACLLFAYSPSNSVEGSHQLLCSPKFPPRTLLVKRQP